MKNLVLAILFGSLVVACNDKGPSSVKLENDDDKTLYTMGFMVGSNLQRLELSDNEMKALYKGLHASAKGDKPEVDIRKFQPMIQEMFKNRMSKLSQGHKKKGEDYIADYLKKNKNAKKTESGLVYEILTEGKGKQPSKDDDVVEVHYHGTLIDGTVFDSSVERKKTVSFPLNRVIKGWTEGLKLIKEGGKVRLVIPPELAYGDAGSPPKIPGGSTLIFEVELFKVNPDDKEEKEKK